MAFRLTLPAHDRDLIPEGRLSGPMPWVIAIMMFLTILAAAAGLALNNSAAQTHADLARRVTVQIVEANPDQRARQTAAVVERLNSLRIVEAVKPIGSDEVKALIEPWIGAEGLDNDIPLPALIDADLRGRADDASLEILRKSLGEVSPKVRVEPHSAWIKPVSDLIRSFQWIALALVLLLALATAAAVLLSSRSALNTHRPTIDVMHLLGATDQQISKLFQRRIALDALFGGLIGLILGGATIWLIGSQLGALGNGLVQTLTLPWHSWMIIILIPFLGVLLAIMMARSTVMRSLRKML